MTKVSKPVLQFRVPHHVYEALKEYASETGRSISAEAATMLERQLIRERPGKRYPLNMRTTFETRQALETAARASGRSLAQEVETRLERSFVEDESRKNSCTGPATTAKALPLQAIQKHE